MRIFTEPEKQFITEHLHQQPSALMLQARRYPDLPVSELVQQIQARQKAMAKLPAWAKNTDLIFPANISVEQSSSEATATFKAALVSGKLLIDLTGGFGADSYYFSKSFAQVIHVEQNRELSEIANYNFGLLGAANIQTIATTAAAFLQDFTGHADVIYLDPARRGDHSEKLHLLQDCEPDILGLLPVLLQKADNILLKASPMLDIELAAAQLGKVAKIWVVAVQNECKEVLYLLQQTPPAQPEREAVNIKTDGNISTFRFNAGQEQTITPPYSDPLTYLYEPNAAILKAGAYKTITQQSTVSKLHPNSHLYTSDTLISDFPGRVFRCTGVSRFNKKELLARLPQKQANITIRNFPDTVAGIRKKTGIKEGGNLYLFFTTDMHQKPLVLYCEKV
ncbi:THUMP-like domain-containing protein [Pontibacter pudoricolor]|uniref:THUMP-like domain-containing protein n=1 Tax=Pontibacter pudoricolor TaxID=2694930 RepID=UPI001390918B|nr:class I SAM-dependent methyltransferase [Pontibacter pudoricolor]